MSAEATSPGGSPSGVPMVSGSRIGGHNIQIGTVGGDVLIALDRPAYRLEMLQDTPEARLPRSRRGPSYLLDVQRQVVPYRPRPDEEQALKKWRDDSAVPVSVVLLHGPGGQGKTRLAAHFASISHADGWAVAQAVEKTPRLRDGTGAVELDRGQPLLVVADYAERWHPSILAQMIDGLAWDLPGRTIRLLLLARPGEGLWQSLCAQLDRTPADLADPIALGDFAGPADREQAYQQAAAAFAVHLEHAGPLPVPPADLDHPDYASALTLHMAALAALYADQRDAPGPDRAGLSDYLLNHEMRYWQATTPGFASPSVIERMVFLSTVFGPLDDLDQARALLLRAHLADGPAQAGLLLDVHHRLYPPATITRPDQAPARSTGRIDHAAAGGFLLPLRPDRFGEDFIAARLRHHASEAVQTLAALTAPGDIRAEEGNSARGPSPAALRRCLIVLTAAAARHPQARTLLLELLDQRPELARHATGDLIDLVINHAGHHLAARFYDALPAYSTDLLQAARDLARHLLHTVPADAPTAVRAYRVAALGMRLAEAGDRRGALKHAREAVGLYRRLAEAEPAAYLPFLAASLTDLSMRLSAVGDKRGALEPSQEAVGLFQWLAEAEPAAYLPFLAGSLNSLAIRLAEVGDKRGALEPAREAVEIRRRLAEADPAAHLPDLAAILNNLGIFLSAAGDERGTLEVSREAVEIRRRLAEADPAAYLPALAASLNNLGMQLFEAGDERGALEVSREAVEIRRRLAEADPAAYLFDLAGSLNNLGMQLMRAGDERGALKASREAVELWRRLAEAEPAACLPDLAGSLLGYAWVCDATGTDLPGGLSAAEEAIGYYHRLVYELPAAFHELLGGAQTAAAKIRARMTPVVRRRDDIGDLDRNAPCPCGSGKKYKRCHGTTGDATAAPVDEAES
nr:tetratricopeptide repeat protein [Microbispora sp. ATCC PTA-5024]